MTQIASRNRLAGETSPYLRQHAQNPVDWYPWSEEAIEAARREDKPILLSIGYSACHWCHVMAHESFEDLQTAAVMNELFINVKVDREERPDLDKIYQLSHQLLNRRSGGWPLTVFLNPHDQVPFFSGTYFPKEARYNLPAFISLLKQVDRYYREQAEAIAKNGVAVREALGRLSQEERTAGELDESLPLKLIRISEASFDRVNGGFGGAPKFPHPSTLQFLLRQSARFDSARNMMLQTLEKMAAGGIYDQLGGGFCRYSVDSEWQIPHFEKMLYDNGPLLGLYAEAAQLSGSTRLRQIAEETGEWILREMQSTEGGYFSSLDADSEGEEGKFYVWDRQTVKSLLTADEYAVFGTHYGLNETPNFEGHWHLHVETEIPHVAEKLGISLANAESLLSTARAKLLVARGQRVRPGLDDKVLTAWNALAIKGLVQAGRGLERVDLLESGKAAFHFLRFHLWRENRLLASYKDGQARHPAYLDDYAFLIDAGLELLQARWDTADLTWIIRLAEDLLERFEDEREGGFFFTAKDHETLLMRPRPLADESMPSGNGVAALALSHLGQLIGDSRFESSAERVLKASASSMAQQPQAHASLLMALDAWRNPGPLLILRALPEESAPWLQEARNALGRELKCYVIPPDAGELPGLLAQRPHFGSAVAYVCARGTCFPPITSPLELSDFKHAPA